MVTFFKLSNFFLLDLHTLSFLNYEESGTGYGAESVGNEPL